MTIPRLELTAAVLAVRMDVMLRTELQVVLEESVFWTDSTSVLRYITNTTKRFHTFVANRVSVIRELSATQQWRYVSSKQNPADDSSRGMTAEAFLKSTRWIQGPEFLWKDENFWPALPEELSPIPSDDPEIKKEVMVNLISMEKEKDTTSKFLEHFSRWTDVQKATAWMLKLKQSLKQLSNKRKEFTDKLKNQDKKELVEQLKKFKGTLRGQRLSLEDMTQAEKAIITFTQGQCFPEEISTLKKGNLHVKRSSAILKLDPVLEDGMLRVGGRISMSAMPQEILHPVILPKECHIAKLILRDIHERVGHGGRGHMLSRLRQKYWILHANTAARKVISECMFCRRQRAKTGEQKMADLPKCRVTPDHPPFTFVGTDFFGPIEVKRGRSNVKRYGVIFTCLASRSVHLEMASSLSTDSCINAIRRFICRRGQVKEMRSDNGTNYVGSERELREAAKELNHSRIESSLLLDGIKWIFNPPSGSHHGGVWERLIRQVKNILPS